MLRNLMVIGCMLAIGSKFALATENQQTCDTKCLQDRITIEQQSLCSQSSESQKKASISTLKAIFEFANNSKFEVFRALECLVTEVTGNYESPQYAAFETATRIIGSTTLADESFRSHVLEVASGAFVKADHWTPVQNSALNLVGMINQTSISYWINPLIRNSDSLETARSANALLDYVSVKFPAHSHDAHGYKVP
jgi:hypothetical protein